MCHGSLLRLQADSRNHRMTDLLFMLAILGSLAIFMIAGVVVALIVHRIVGGGIYHDHTDDD